MAGLRPSTIEPNGQRSAPWLGRLLWLGLALTAAAVAAAVTPACGVALPWGGSVLNFCQSPAAEPQSNRPDLLEAMASQRILERELHRLQLQLARVPDCPPREVSPETAAVPPPATPAPLPVAPDPAPPPEPDPPPEPELAAAPPFEPPQPGTRPAAPPRPVPPPPPEPDPAPPDDRLRIPDDVDRTGDLAFLAGCWRTDPFRHSPAQGSPGTSTYCFDAQGRGSLTFRRSGIACTAPARVEILPGGRLRIWDANTVCNDGTLWFQDRLDCAGGGGGVAQCSGESDGDVRWVVNLHRV